MSSRDTTSVSAVEQADGVREAGALVVLPDEAHPPAELGDDLADGLMGAVLDLPGPVSRSAGGRVARAHVGHLVDGGIARDDVLQTHQHGSAGGNT